MEKENKQITLRRVVVTGMGAITPLGHDVPSTWQALCEGRSGCAPIQQFNAEKFKTQFACEVKNFDVEQLMDRKEARKMDRCAHYALWAAREAMVDSALNLEQEDKTRMGVIFGTGMGGYNTICNEMRDYYLGDGTPRFSPFFMPKNLPSMIAGLISIQYGLQGASLTVNSACASSTSAIIRAYDQIRLGRAEVIVSGGAEASVSEGGVGGFNALRGLSTRNDSPETASRPFSASRDGFVVGEGAVCLIMEELEHAKARGAKIYGELLGVGETSDAFHMTAPDPEGKGSARVMQLAVEDAGLRPEDVDYINTHGTSTPLGDVAELKAIQQYFGEHAYRLNIDSTKSMTGHLLGAAGALEAMATILALRDGIVPPTINHEEDDEDENIDYRLNLTFNKAQHRDMHYALSNTFGFGGHNASLLFSKF